MWRAEKTPKDVLSCAQLITDILKKEQDLKV